MEHYTPLGYGSTGVVVYGTDSYPPYALKLYHAPADEAGILREATLQAKAVTVLAHTVKVPAVHTATRRPIVYGDEEYIAGIYMDPIPGHAELDGAQLHIALGLLENQQEWLPCGFFPSRATLDQYLTFRRSRYTLESMAHALGRAHRALLDAGIVPDDVKFLYGADNHIWMCGFHRCKIGRVDPIEWLNDRRRSQEPYAPREGQRGRIEYLAGFLHSTTK